jgi:large subunit ribosomal protein L2
MKLKNIPLGTVISCVEMKPGQGAILQEVLVLQLN